MQPFGRPAAGPGRGALEAAARRGRDFVPKAVRPEAGPTCRRRAFGTPHRPEASTPARRKRGASGRPRHSARWLAHRAGVEPAAALLDLAALVGRLSGRRVRGNAGPAREAVLDHVLRAIEEGWPVEARWCLGPELLSAVAATVGQDEPRQIRPLFARIAAGHDVPAGASTF